MFEVFSVESLIELNGIFLENGKRYEISQYESKFFKSFLLSENPNDFSPISKFLRKWPNFLNKKFYAFEKMWSFHQKIKNKMNFSNEEIYLCQMNKKSILFFFNDVLKIIFIHYLML